MHSLAFESANIPQCSENLPGLVHSTFFHWFHFTDI